MLTRINVYILIKPKNKEFISIYCNFVVAGNHLC